MASVSILSDYLRTHDIVLRPTVEQTVNEVLVSLALSSLNVDKGPYRYELISACAVVLNGIPRINDPVLLLENLGNAFERRSGCIYTQTVKQAFERLQTDAVRRGQTKKMLAVWDSWRNRDTKMFTLGGLPFDHALSWIESLKPIYHYAGSFHLVSSRKLSFENLERLLHHSDEYIRVGAHKGVIERADLHGGLRERLLGSGRSVHRKELESTLKHEKNTREALHRLAQQVARRKERVSHDLGGISGSRGYRKRRMMQLTNPLRSKPK